MIFGKGGYGLANGVWFYYRSGKIRGQRRKLAKKAFGRESLPELSRFNSTGGVCVFTPRGYSITADKSSKDGHGVQERKKASLVTT